MFLNRIASQQRQTGKVVATECRWQTGAGACQVLAIQGYILDCVLDYFTDLAALGFPQHRRRPPFALSKLKQHGQHYAAGMVRNGGPCRTLHR